MIRSLLLPLLIASVACQTPASDKITSLPGFTKPVPFNQYAGYLTVDASHGRKLFYWFVESQRNPQKDPVVLWLNGGPGCSSLIGFLSENGPFRPTVGGDTLFEDKNSWNHVANVLYLEAPAGVGFSFSNVQSDYNTGDAQTAADNYAALQQWFKRFPQFSANEFYVSGESYGGHYVPDLANAVLNGNASPKNIHINLMGILVGNGVTVNSLDLNSYIDVYGYHALIPWSLYTSLVQTCKGEYNNFVSDACNQLVNQAGNAVGNIDPYDIYAPVCNSNTSSKGYNPIRFDHPALRHKFDPCIDLHLTEYLNRADVRKAIHADPSVKEWDECSSVLNYNFTYQNGENMIHYYRRFINAKLRILVYSGDVDSVVSFLGTEKWIDSLNLNLAEAWRTWLVDEQTAGYVKAYEGLTFLTIRGAGHMVPYFKPKQGFAFFQRFIDKQPF